MKREIQNPLSYIPFTSHSWNRYGRQERLPSPLHKRSRSRMNTVVNHQNHKFMNTRILEFIAYKKTLNYALPYVVRRMASENSLHRLFAGYQHKCSGRGFGERSQGSVRGAEYRLSRRLGIA